MAGKRLNHQNRHHHNWLIDRINDRFTRGNAQLYRGTLYDLGCGEASYRDFFLEYANRYIGVDWAESFHSTRADIIADLNEPLPVDSEVADTIVSLSVLEHLSQPQLMLVEACRMLKPGGTILCQVPWQWWIHEAPYDFFRYSPHGLQLMFREAGFVNVVLQPSAGFFTTIALKWNYFSTRFLRGAFPVCWALLAAILPLWCIGQWAAQLLDRVLDRNWSLEAPGYYVTARKL